MKRLFKRAVTQRGMRTVDYTPLFAAYERVQSERERQATESAAPRNALEAFLHDISEAKSGSGFQRIARCR